MPTVSSALPRRRWPGVSEVKGGEVIVKGVRVAKIEVGNHWSEGRESGVLGAHVPVAGPRGGSTGERRFPASHQC